MKNIAKHATHVPLLTRAFDLSKGNILELGTGYFSSTLLDWLCAISGRKLVSYESNPGWYERSKRLQSDYHDIHLVKDWDKIPLEETQWGLVFIDHSPKHRRAVELKRLKDNADYIVIHDTEPRSEKLYGYPDIYHLFKNRFDDNKVEPWTTVLSNKSLYKF